MPPEPPKILLSPETTVRLMSVSADNGELCSSLSSTSVPCNVVCHGDEEVAVSPRKGLE